MAGADEERPMTPHETAIERRRSNVRQLLARKLSQGQMAEALSVSRKTIEKDVAAIKLEMARAMATTTIVEVAGDVLRRSEARDRELWLMYQRAAPTPTNPKGDPATAMAALRELRANANDEVRVLQSLGLVYKAPERMAVDMRVMTQLETLPPDVLRGLADASDPATFQQLLASVLGESGAAEVMGLPGPSPMKALAGIEEIPVEEVHLTTETTDDTAGDGAGEAADRADQPVG